MRPIGVTYVIAEAGVDGWRLLRVGHTNNLADKSWAAPLAEVRQTHLSAELLIRLNVSRSIREAEGRRLGVRGRVSSAAREGPQPGGSDLSRFARQLRRLARISALACGRPVSSSPSATAGLFSRVSTTVQPTSSWRTAYGGIVPPRSLQTSAGRKLRTAGLIGPQAASTVLQLREAAPVG